MGGGVRIIKVRVAKVHGAYLVKQGEARQAREDTVALLLYSQHHCVDVYSTDIRIGDFIELLLLLPGDQPVSP
jgi:hypothetical protein